MPRQAGTTALHRNRGSGQMVQLDELRPDRRPRLRRVLQLPRRAGQPSVGADDLREPARDRVLERLQSLFTICVDPTVHHPQQHQEDDRRALEIDDVDAPPANRPRDHQTGLHIPDPGEQHR